MKKELILRSDNKCEICGAQEGLAEFVVPSRSGENNDEVVVCCQTCKSQLEDDEKIDPNHWRCLNDSMWSEVPGVKVIAYRMLNKLKGKGWPVDLLEMMYIEDDLLAWAKEGMVDENTPKYLDSNGAEIFAGDTVILIKDLDVKGAGFTAKRGTAVRNVRLVPDDNTHIEGKVNGQTIHIVTKFVKK